jgi:hypothetical protein
MLPTDTGQATGWLMLDLTPFGQLGLDGQDRDACAAWLRLNRISGPAAIVHIDSRATIGHTLFVTEIEPDGTSPYLAHIRAQPLLAPPPPRVRALFVPAAHAPL